MSHNCDCDVCRGSVDVPALNILNDSHEEEVKVIMTNKIETHVPAALRKWAVRSLDVQTQDEQSLVDACKATGLGNSQRSSTIPLTNGALGVLIRQARKWGASSNGNEVMASKSVLSRHELNYEPDDPRERVHAVKMPKSVMSYVQPSNRGSSHGESPQTIRDDLNRMSWTNGGASGRVRVETLGFLLDKMRHLRSHPHPATQRAASKFVTTYTETYEQSLRLINGYLGSEVEEDQAPEPEPLKDEILSAAGFMEAIHGRGPELVEDEPEEKPRKPLVVIACGGKKSDAPGKIPADERYTGNYFRACLMASEVMEGPTMIISAKYGLIPLSEEIENYDVKIGDTNTITVGAVRAQVEALGLEDAQVTILGGEKYVTALRKIWPDAEAPLKGGIGKQLKQLAEMYEGDPLDEEKPEEEAPERAYQTTLSEVGYLPHRNQPKPRVMWFGGKAGKRNPQPGKWEKAEVVYTGEGKYAIHRFGTTEELMVGSLRSLVHWGPLEDPRPENKPEFVRSFKVEPRPAPIEVEDQEHEEPPTPAGNYEVPANFLELAEEGNTEAARLYWTRRCEEYRRTGK